VWGGEFLKIDEYGYVRAMRLRPLRLAGSERAVREPRRCGLGVLFEAFGDEALEGEEFAPVRAFAASERRIVAAMLRQGLNSPWTSSAGRLFDAVASLMGVRQISRYEGQAAMELEWLALDSNDGGVYEFEIVVAANAETPGELDWAPMVRGILADIDGGIQREVMARRFHNTLAEMIVSVAAAHAELPVALSGGCFQNRLLTELTVARLESSGKQVYWHQRVPPNDGGIALGQVMAAARQLRLAGKTRDEKCV
jgi:hydrogenase maturation protein HypF